MAVAASLALVAGCIAIVADSGYVAPPEITSPKDGATVPTLTEGQKSFIKMPRKRRIQAFADRRYRARMKSFGYYPKPLELAWTYKSGGVPTPYEVRLFKEGKDPFSAKCILATNIVSATLANCIVVDNLEIGRNYSWEVSTGGFHTRGRFTTEDQAPRLIRLPGVPNVRDIGGRKGLDGRRVKQGMVYRSAGLNDNAVYTYCTDEEALASDPEMAARDKEYAKQIDFWKKHTGDNPEKTLKFVDVRPGREWALFFPTLAGEGTTGGTRPARALYATNAVPVLESLTSIPKFFLDAPREMLVLEDGVTHFFDQLGVKGPAIMMQEIDSPADGYMPITAGGDYWWELRANGKVVADLLDSPGNWRSPYCPTNFAIPVPLKKGRNLIAVTLFTGVQSWSWGYAAAPDRPVADFAEDMAAIAERRRRDSVKQKVKSVEMGAYRLDEEGTFYATNVLRIVSDIDLRSDKECWGMEGSPLGERVKWYHYSSSCYGGMQEEWGREAFSNVFRVFLDEKNYPIDFHCIAGQDRTGAVAFIVNGLLGVKEEELYLDWEVTGFWNPSGWFTHKNLFNKLYHGFDKYPGRTINDRIEAYVLDIGFTKEDIEKLRSIMLE